MSYFIFQALQPMNTEKMTMKLAIKEYSSGSMYGCFAILIYMLIRLAFHGENNFSSRFMPSTGELGSTLFIYFMISVLFSVVATWFYKSSPILGFGYFNSYFFIAITKSIPIEFTPILFDSYTENAIADILANWSILAIFVVSLISWIVVSKKSRQ